jgi:hypothetical protein
MLGNERMTRTLFLLILCAATSQFLAAADLSAESLNTFTAYDRKVEQAVRTRVAAGSVVSLRQKVARNGKGAFVDSAADPNPSDIGSAYIHDWIGAIFIPGANVAQVKRVLQDFDRHKQYFQPEVIESKLIEKNGDEYRSALRLRKKKILTVILSTEFSTRFSDLSPTSGYSIARSTRVSEVENPGSKEERVLPPGTGQGFLWNLNSYWTWEEKDGGVYLECRAVSLSRDVPTGLGWIVDPIIRSLPKESLQATLESTRKAVLAQAAR